MKHALSPRTILLLTLMCFSLASNAIEASLGLHQMQEKVQSTSGKEDADPMSPALTLGHTFQTPWGLWFSPSLGYIQNKTNSDDDFSSYKIETITLNYNFVYLADSWNDYALRFGISNFTKKIKDNGDSVSIPNGSGTATAYRPKQSTSYTMTWNLGVDINLKSLFADGPGFGSIYSNTGPFEFKSYAMRFMINIFSPIREKHRTMGFHLAGVFYF